MDWFALDWFSWNVVWSLVGSLVWFMTIASHPDAEIADGEQGAHRL